MPPPTPPTPPSNKPTILILGGGPAGSTTAYWLARAGFEVTIAERTSSSRPPPPSTPSSHPTTAPSKFASGQGIDLTGPSIPIVEKMGLLAAVKERTTGEKGFAISGDDSEVLACFGAGRGPTLTQEVEVMRGVLVGLLASKAEGEGVRWLGGVRVKGVREVGEGEGVDVTFEDEDGEGGERKERFGVVVGADGLGSKTRRFVFDGEELDGCYSSFGQFCAYFSIEGEVGDVPNSRLQHAVGRRTVLIRPTKAGSTERSSCYMLYFENEKMEGAMGRSVQEQKDVLRDVFKDFPGRFGKRALEGMEKAEDFYYSETAQIRLPTWSKGRCVLVGDAAYAPSPASGQGTVLAILGAYILAGELAKSPGDIGGAFERYEANMRDYVNESQSKTVGGTVARIAIPETYTGIRILRFCFWLAAWSGVWRWFSLKEGKFELPEYDFGPERAEE